METDRTVRFSILIKAPKDRVYDALATADGLDAWFTSGTELDPVTGGRIRFRWKDWGHADYCGDNEGMVLEVDRPDRFVFKWTVDTGEYLTTVEMDFESLDEGTLVKLIEYGYEDNADGTFQMMVRAGGWGHALTLLKFYLEYGLTE